ncbi:BZ3500_MvSof-1268-A1-R1_Chr5-2g07967 [Microbotryum saponariae]|uniref:BZ3500_MvSof-1268-A1-R1_Chr5-2g07967 protein n=1 Tax=Microbotryum saponariae TaxID=289078 RepID=A0A2X0NJ86_9BASI|nr:BZ3500_MvSof-1268-A1-R1_Chr5-2g07967 [Microbotryum saponariae]SDA05836.1 BZ3501_MvSof-1269-A2-R1_Chr5-2g07789 [Microbotryum saponariae]
MDINDIFKRPPLPPSGAAAGTKRKLEAPTPDLSSFKQHKTDTSPTDGAPPAAMSANTNGKGKGKASVTIRDGPDDDDDDQDGDNDGAPDGEFAPGNDADYFAEEDEDGRFFGGGLNSVQKEVLNMMDKADDKFAASGELTAPGVRRQLLALEKAIDENRRLRTKFPTDPTKFVDSEFTLIEALNALLVLSSFPALSYPILIELNTPESLADLLSHENTDVSNAVVEVLEEWLDPESLDDEDEEEEGGDEGGSERKLEATKKLVESLTQFGIVDLAVSGLARLNEEDGSERGGVFHILGLLENFISLTPAIATSLLAPTATLLSYLVERLSMDKKPADWDQNRFYAAEMLSLLLSLPVDGVAEGRKTLAEQGHVDALLKILSTYRRRDPSGADETEFMENIFDILCSSLSEPTVKKVFMQGEGIELMCLMLKEKKLSKTRAIKTLDHALQGFAGMELCVEFVEALGLKVLFTTFMGKGASKKASGQLTHESTEHLLSILSSLLTSLASDSPQRLRLLSKFVEADYEKLDRLIDLREETESRVNAGDGDDEFGELDEDELYLEKLERGLFSLQLIDYILAWMTMEDDGAREHILMMLARRNKSFDDIIRVLSEYRDNIGEGAAKTEEKEGSEIDEAEEQREILKNLIEYLKSLE